VRRSLAASILAPLLLLPLAACTGSGSPVDPPATEATEVTSAQPTGPIVTSTPGVSPLGLKWSWFQPDTFDFVRRASGGWTFAELDWCEIEPVQGQRDWTELDEVVRESIAMGHEPMLKLRTGQCWATQPPTTGDIDTTEAAWKKPSTPPVDTATYLAFVTEAVQRYAALGVHEYAVENEIDVVNFWATEVSAYEQLVRDVVPAVRAADPEARVLDAGVSSTSYGVVMAADQLAAGDEAGALQTYQDYYGRRLASDVSRWPTVNTPDELRSVLDSGPARRSVQAEDLSVRLATEGLVDAYQLHYYEPVSALPALLDHLQEELGGAVPIEGWEIGVAWPGDDYDERAHADQVFQLVATLLAHDVHRVVYLPVAYTPSDKTQVFRGLAHEDGSVLPAGLGWIALNEALTDLGDAQPAAVTGDLSGVTWTIGRRDWAILWSTGEPAPLPDGVVDGVVDATGAEVPADQPVCEAPVLVSGSLGDDLAGRLVNGG
jgi:hypothetical protein